MYDLRNREAIMHLRKLNILWLEPGHIVCLPGSISGSFKRGQILRSMQAVPASLSDSSYMDGNIGESLRNILSDQQQARCTIANRTAVKEMHWPGHGGVHGKGAQIFLLIFPVGYGLSFLLAPLDSCIHEITNAQRNLTLGVQGGVIVALD